MIDIKYRALVFAALLMALTTGNAFKIKYIDTLFISIHENITTEAISKKSIRLANNRVIQFTSGALAYVIEANTESDELHFDAPDYHFDEDRFAESTSNLEAWKREIAKAAIEDNISSSLTNFHVEAPGAHDLLGRSLHLVQDFYAHSSWVDIKQVNQKLRHPRFGQADALNHIALDDAGVQRAGWNESMAACDAAGYIAASNLLTTGYYDTGMSLADINPSLQGSFILRFPHIIPYSLLIADENQRAELGFYTKRWKEMIGNHWLDSRCIHGGDTGPGLNKDKPGRPGHEEAYQAAVTGSAMFLDEVIAEIRRVGGKDADRAVCKLLGHTPLSDCDMPIELATVDRITSDATTAFIGEAVKFIVLGSNIPGSAVVTMENATCELYTVPSSNGFTAICIPYRPGNSDVKVIGAFGDEPLKTKSYNVEVANLQLYPSISEIYQKISFTLSNVYLLAKNAEWSISDALGKIAMGVSVGVEKTVSYVFEIVGKWTIDVAFLDAAGNSIGAKVSKVIDVGDSAVVSGSANITSVNTASGEDIPEGSSTFERRPKLSGTLSVPISSYFSVWVYLDDARLAPATVDGTSWAYTATSDMPLGAHKFTVGVVRFDGVEGSASVARRLTVVNEVGAGDLSANFSSSKNPNGQWSYGWISPAPDAQFKDFDKPEQYTNVPPLFYDAANANLRYWTAGTPYSLFVAANIGSTPLVFRGVPWQGNSVWQHPGRNGEMAVSRWIAPKSGTFKIDAAFSLLENGSVDVRILKNGLPLFSDYLSSSKMATSNSTMGNVDIAAGDKLDFVVGYGGDNYLADETMVSVSITPATPTSSGLVGYWSFDDCTAADNSGNGGNGQLKGSPVCEQGVAGSGMKLNSTNWIDVPSRPSLEFTNSFTISVWFKAEALTDERSVRLVDKTAAGVNDGYLLSVWASGLSLIGGGPFGVVSNPIPITNNVYHHAAVTFGNGIASFYLDGVPIGSRPVGAMSMFVNPNRGLRIGAAQGPDAHPTLNNFVGVIDEVRLYNTKLSDGNVADLFLSTRAQASNRLPGTGIKATQCYRGGSNVLVNCASPEAIAMFDKQDGMVTPGSAGTNYALVQTAEGGSYDRTECVQDNITGLVWEGKTADAGLRGQGQRYTNTSSGLSNDTRGYANAVNAIQLCGRSDWRLPTASELQLIVNYGAVEGMALIEDNWFPNTALQQHWTTSTLQGRNPAVSMFVDFRSGDVGGLISSQLAAVRLVSGAARSAAAFEISVDGTEAKDPTTGLIWRRCIEGASWNGAACTSDGTTSFTHEAAFARAINQRSASRGWRVPNVKELTSLVRRDGAEPTPYIDNTIFPGTPNGYFWTSSPFVSQSSMAWTVYFGYGSTGSNQSRATPRNLRLVRND